MLFYPFLLVFGFGFVVGRGLLVGSVGRAADEDLVAGVDQSAQEGFGDNGFGEESVAVDHRRPCRGGFSEIGQASASGLSGCGCD
jgi:hypothetical protein